MYFSKIATGFDFSTIKYHSFASSALGAMLKLGTPFLNA